MDFKIGQRVRIVNARNRLWSDYVGKEATIRGITSMTIGDPAYSISIDGVGDDYITRGEDLEPLTPPGQKEFKAEDILHLPNLPDFKTMTPEFARAWGGA